MIKLSFLKKYQYENRLTQVRRKYLPWIAKGKKNAGTRFPNLA